MSTNQTAFRGPRVLLVEDDTAVRELLAERLEASGCLVVAVDAAEEGIVESGETAFDAVVSDVHLPGKSGLDMAACLIAQDPGLPVILLTGDPDEELARDALALGPVSYLVKPIQLFEFESVVQLALARRGWLVGAGGELMKNEPGGSSSEVPEEWLEFVDTESFAGPGHGDRVARIAEILLSEVPADNREIGADDLALAARTHEVGRLASPDAEPAATAAQSAELMTEAGFPRLAVRAVRHMHEHWDGTGGSDALTGVKVPMAARVLAVADALDHYAAAWLQAGLSCDNAIDRAIHLVTVQQSMVFGPSVVAGLHRRMEDVRRVIADGQGSDTNETLTTAAFSPGLAALPFKVA